MDRNRCASCGCLKRDGHEVWCQYYRPPIPVGAASTPGAMDVVWMGFEYEVTLPGPIPVLVRKRSTA